jgi:hypothetical protein
VAVLGENLHSKLTHPKKPIPQCFATNCRFCYASCSALCQGLFFKQIYGERL